MIVTFPRAKNHSNDSWRCNIGKRSEFTRRPQDKYYTPAAAVVPLIPYLTDIKTFAEPCAGDGRLIRHIEAHGPRCVWRGDIAPPDIFEAPQDALSVSLPPSDAVITNPPWNRPILHAMIDRFLTQAPQVWLLFDSDWPHTLQSGTVPRLIRHCSHIVAIGRVKWIEGSTMSGKDNCCWYRFALDHTDGPKFFPRNG